MVPIETRPTEEQETKKKNTKEEKKLIHVAPPQGLVDGVDVRSKSTTMNLKATFWSKKFGS
jgi:hypothetical protein